MSRAKQRIRKFHDATGVVRVALHYGLSAPEFDQEPYAQFVDPSGMRVDRHGRPVRQSERSNFGAIDWDLPPPPVVPPAGEATVAAVWSLVIRSATFGRLFDAVRRAGLTLRNPRSDGISGVLLGTPYIDVAAAPRSGFVGRLVEEVAVAFSFLDGIGLAHASASPEHVRVNAAFLIERYGRAKLLAALIRDEILVSGGPDIGGPGLRGTQLEVFDRHRTGMITFEVAALEIGRAPDGDTALPFDRRRGPPAARNLTNAFGDRLPAAAPGLPSPLRAPRVDPEIAPLASLIESLASIAQPAREAAQHALAIGFDVIDIANPYWTVSRCAARSPVLGIDLHEPNDRSPGGRFVLYPERALSVAQITGRFAGAVPFHVGARASDRRATMAFPVGHRTLFAGYDIETGGIDTLVVGPPLRR